MVIETEFFFVPHTFQCKQKSKLQLYSECLQYRFCLVRHRHRNGASEAGGGRTEPDVTSLFPDVKTDQSREGVTTRLDDFWANCQPVSLAFIYYLRKQARGHSFNVIPWFYLRKQKKTKTRHCINSHQQPQCRWSLRACRLSCHFTSQQEFQSFPLQSKQKTTAQHSQLLMRHNNNDDKTCVHQKKTSAHFFGKLLQIWGFGATSVGIFCCMKRGQRSFFFLFLFSFFLKIFLQLK